MVPVSEALAGRVWIWRNALDAAGRVQPFGTGLGGFAHVFHEAQGRRLAPLAPRTASRQFHNAQTAHQDALQALVETGVPGLLLLLGAFAMTVRSFAGARWTGGLAVMTAVAVCAMGDSPLQQPGVVYLVGMVLGAEPSLRVSNRWRWAGLAVLFVVASVLMAQGVRRWLAGRWVHEAQSAALVPRKMLLERAVRVSPASGEAALALGLARLEHGDTQGAVEALTRSRVQLANVGTDIALGNAQMELGEVDAAIATYRGALHLNPGSLRGHANLAEALRVRGHLSEAQEHLDIAKQLSPGHPKLPALEENLRRSRREAEMAP
jgi:Flp pilus assembly protein TadD